MNAEKPNEEQKQEIQEINRWVKEQTESTSFGYVFRGWYPNETYTDKNCGDASTYDLPEYYRILFLSHAASFFALWTAKISSRMQSKNFCEQGLFFAR